MFKRANKMTALLVAAASVMSMVPAFAADVKKIDSEDGVVYGAVAYKDGAALIDGEIDDNDGAYYLADGKYTELEDVDSGADYVAYGSKYVNVDEGDYFVDLTSGTVTDDDLNEDDADDAASALRKKAKDVDRYGDDSTTIANLTVFPGNKFGDTWYYTTDYKAVAGKLGNGLATGGSYNIFTDKDGNYIDADYNLGKIKVETTSHSATIENTTDAEDLNATGDAKAVVTASKPLGQDKDNLYRYAEITVTLTGGANYGKVTINNKEFTVVASGSDGQVVLPVIQKISKAQDSDDIDDAKFAKTVYNYVISDDSAAVDATAKNFIKNTATQAAVIGGKLAVSAVDDTITNADNVTVQAMSLKSKNGYYYTDLEDKTTIQAEYSDDLEKVAFDTDVDGNIYVIDGGYVKEFDGTDDWNKVYKVDGSFDSLSVYDKDNMVAWSQDDEVYSVIGGKKAADDTTTPEVPAVTAGWVQAANGTWSYNKADGTKATGWLQAGSAWYFLKADGTMATGWVQDGATWYYLQASGAMATGWLNDNGTWYYLNASGAMAANTTVDGYVLGANGAWVK